MLSSMETVQGQVEIALVGKYTQLHDAYLSVVEALAHAGGANHVKVKIRWVDSESLTVDNALEHLTGCGGILVPGGFGDRGIEGMVAAAYCARTKGIPYLGICLGMQIAVWEFARHVLELEDAHSTEFRPRCAHPVIDLMPDQLGQLQMGGTLRLGAYPCQVHPGSLLEEVYESSLIHERHRHRYEFSSVHREAFEAEGMLVSGLSPDGRLVEAVEIKAHPFFIGVQYHPEFKSRPHRAHPLFRRFVQAAIKQQG